jgi:hypothetical protein
MDKVNIYVQIMEADILCSSTHLVLECTSLAHLDGNLARLVNCKVSADKRWRVRIKNSVGATK